MYMCMCMYVMYVKKYYVVLRSTRSTSPCTLRDSLSPLIAIIPPRSLSLSLSRLVSLFSHTHRTRSLASLSRDLGRHREFLHPGSYIRKWYTTMQPAQPRIVAERHGRVQEKFAKCMIFSSRTRS